MKTNDRSKGLSPLRFRGAVVDISRKSEGSPLGRLHPLDGPRFDHAGGRQHQVLSRLAVRSRSLQACVVVQGSETQHIH